MIHKKRKQILNRLARIEGHIRGISKMVESERGCSEVLLQIVATQAALKKVSKMLLEDHIDTCILDALKSNDYEMQLDELKEALSNIL